VAEAEGVESRNRRDAAPPRCRSSRALILSFVFMIRTAHPPPPPPPPSNMFKRFSTSEVSALSLLKTSKARAIRKLVVEQFPASESVMEDIMPKKADLHEAKSTVNDNHVTLVIANKKILFFRVREGPLIPTMPLVHKCTLQRLV
jgi:hypothetical protein